MAFAFTACSSSDDSDDKTPQPVDPTPAGVVAVDLGLPSGTKWSCCDLGADKPKAGGDLYAWGETETKDKYEWENYIHCDGTAETCHDIGNEITQNEEGINNIFNECYLVLQKLYENLILKMLFNENLNKLRKVEEKNEICEKYINEFFIFVQKPKNNDEIINKINDNISKIIKGLYNSIHIILIYLKSSNSKLEEASKEDPELLNIEINETEEVFSDSIKNLDNINELNTIVNLCNFYVDKNSEIFQKFLEKVSLDQYKCFNTIFSYFNLIINKNKKTKKIPTKFVKKPPIISHLYIKLFK